MIEKIEISNFTCFGESVTCDFNNYGKNILLVGRNLDQSGFDSNGSGKSNFIKAIIWTIFGQYPEMVSADRVVRDGTEQCFVNLSFDSGVTISRCRGKNNRLNLYVGDEDRTMKTNTETQKEIYRLFGLDIRQNVAYNDFLNRAYFSPIAVKSFVGSSSTSADKMNLLMRFIEADQGETIIKKCREINKEIKLVEIDVDVESLKNEILSAESEIKKVSANIKRIEGELSELLKFKDQIERKSKIESEINSLINSISVRRKASEGKREILRNTLKDKKESLAEIEKEKKKIELALKKYDAAKLEQMKKDLDKFNSDREKLNSEINESMISLKNLEREISELDEQIESEQFCPKCKAELAVVDGQIYEHDSKKIKKALSEKKLKADAVEEEMKTLDGSMRDIDSEIESLTESISDMTILAENIKVMESSISDQSKIEEMIKKINSEGIADKKEFEAYELETSKKIAELRIDLDSIEIPNDIEDKMIVKNHEKNDLTENKYKLESVIKEAESKIELAKIAEKDNKKNQERMLLNEQAIELLSTSTKIAIKHFLPFFAEVVTKYLSIFESGFTFEPEIDLERFRDSFKIMIDDGYSKYFFDDRSSGERARVALAVGFSLIEIANSVKGNKFDFMFSDEAVDIVDNVGKNLFFDMLNNESLRDVQKIVVSHDSDLKDKFESYIEIFKKDGVSWIE